MAQERAQGKEGSIWDSRLFKAGLVIAAAGGLLGAWLVATAGVATAGTGAGWYWVNKGKG